MRARVILFELNQAFRFLDAIQCHTYTSASPLSMVKHFTVTRKHFSSSKDLCEECELKRDTLLKSSQGSHLLIFLHSSRVPLSATQVGHIFGPLSKERWRRFSLRNSHRGLKEEWRKKSYLLKKVTR